MSLWKRLFAKPQQKARRQETWMIGNATVVCAMTSASIEKMASAGVSESDAVTVAYVQGRKPKGDELVVSFDGTIRLSKSAKKELDSLFIYRDSKGVVLMTDARVEGSLEYKFIGNPDLRNYAIAMCLSLKLDPNKLRM